MRVPPPMLATAASRLPSGEGWTYEVKWDGYRTLAVLDSGSVRLLSRNLKNTTASYPSIVRAVAKVTAPSAILDGEIVALDESGQPSFQALHHGAGHTLVFYAFDLLLLNGRELIALPIEQRRDELASLVRKTPVLLSEPLPGSPEQIEAAIRRMRLEGIVAKRARSRYEPGRRSRSWIKVRFNRRQEFVIGGYKPGPSNFESILVGYYQGRKLLFASKVRAGFREQTRGDVQARIEPLVATQCPFANLPNSGTSHWGEGITAEDMTKLIWVQPKVVVEVEFVEWTLDGLLRHPVFMAVRDDKLARGVRREIDARGRK
jgi:bifunctional non-homologous end joining protein LigD